MKIKTNIEFEAFSDGICSVYSQDEVNQDKYSIIHANLGFTEKTIGYKRYYTASNEQVRIDRLIRIPHLSNINNHGMIKIDKKTYTIELIQPMQYSNPPSLQLTLKELEMFDL